MRSEVSIFPFIPVRLVKEDAEALSALERLCFSSPWKLEQQMNNVLPWLHSKLVPAGTGHATVSWIVPE